MTRAAYYRICLTLPVSWLRWCVDEPSSTMRPRHVALLRLAIRTLTDTPATIKARWYRRQLVSWFGWEMVR